MLFRHNGKVAIRGELSASQQLITNDLLPAVAGMALRVVTHNGEPVKEVQNQEEPAS